MQDTVISERTRVDWRDALGLLIIAAIATLAVTPVLTSPIDADSAAWLAAAAFPIGAAAFVVAYMIGSMNRKRNLGILRRNEAITVLPSDRLGQTIGAIAMLAVTPQLLVWLGVFASEAAYSLWGTLPLLAFFGVSLVRTLIKEGGPIVIDRTGIRHPDLWEGALRWSDIREIRHIKDGSAKLAIDLITPTAFPSGSAKNTLSRDASGTLLLVPADKFRVPAADIAAFLRNRVEAHRRDGSLI